MHYYGNSNLKRFIYSYDHSQPERLELGAWMFLNIILKAGASIERYILIAESID